MKTKLLFLVALILSAGFPLAAFAISYQPGQTLNPSCPPSDATCIVVPNTSGSFSATSTSATSTFAGGVQVAGTASSTNVVVSGSLTIGSLNGVLKAVAGLITSALVNLASDVTGILGIPNGGTGISSAPAYGQVLIGNGSGGYVLTATSSLGITAGADATWGSITGILSSQSDLQNALNGKLGSSTISSLSANYDPFWNGNAFVNGALYDTGTAIGIGTTTPTQPLTIASSNASGTAIRIGNTSTGGHIFDLLSSGSDNTGGAGRFDIFDVTSGIARLSVQSGGNVGIGTTSPASLLSVAGKGYFTGSLTAPIQDNGGQVFNAQAYGWLPDNTDHSVQALALLTAVSNAGGGTIYFPPSKGTYRADSQLLIPNAAGTPSPTQVNIRLTGAGGGENWYANYAPNAVILDLRYQGTGGKIETLGRGTLSIDHLTIEDGGSANSTPLIHSTNTTLTIRDNTFIGTGTTTQDAIVLGGTVASITSDTTGAFQGYGTIIDSNVFTKLNRGVYLRTWANAVVITNNSWIQDTGTSAAIQSDGSVSPSNGNYGLTISGNTIEMTTYTYGIELIATLYSIFSGNSFWDPGSHVVNNYYLTNLSSGNTFVAGVGSLASVATYPDFGGDATSLSLSNIIGYPNHTLSPTGYGEAGNQLSGGLVVDGSYTNTNEYIGGLTVASTFTPTDHISIVYDDTNDRGIIEAKNGTLPESLTLDPSGGNVGIGTTSPQTLLGLQGGIGVNSPQLYLAGNGNVGMGTTTPGSILALGSLANFTTATSTFYSTGGIDLTGGCFSIKGACINGGGGGGSSQWTTAGSEIYYNGGGNVGIGTTNPGSTLEVEGTVAAQLFNATSTTLASQFPYASTTALSVSGTSYAGSQSIGGQTNGGTGALLSVATGIYTPGFIWATGGLTFATGNTITSASVNGTALARVSNGLQLANGGPIISYQGSTGMEILQSNGLTLGNVIAGTTGIGTTSPLARLDVAGANNSTVPLFQLSSVASFATTTEFVVMNSGNATLTGCLNYNGGTSGTCLSDERVKQDITPFTNGLEEIIGLNPVTYEYNGLAGTPDDGDVRTGLIAQQVQQVAPDLVSTTSALLNPTDTALTQLFEVNYSALTFLLINSVKEIASISGEFELNLISWLGDASNGIQALYAAVGNFGQVNTQQINADELCLGSTCVTQAQLQALLAAANQSRSAPASPSPSAAAATDTPPVIQINGDNPAVIQVGASYADLGATITGPQADLNLAIQTYLNGTLESPMEIDTSAAATDTIADVVTDSQGLISTSTRTVIVELVPASPVPLPTAASSSAAVTIQ